MAKVRKEKENMSDWTSKLWEAWQKSKTAEKVVRIGRCCGENAGRGPN